VAEVVAVDTAPIAPEGVVGTAPVALEGTVNAALVVLEGVVDALPVALDGTVDAVPVAEVVAVGTPSSLQGQRVSYIRNMDRSSYQ
jgi:hypothetical protein